MGLTFVVTTLPGAVVLTAAGVWLHWSLPPRGLSAYTLQALGLALAYALVRTIAHRRAKKAADAAPYAPPLPLSPAGSDGPHRPPGPPGC